MPLLAPPVPAACRTLIEPESQRLRQQYPNLWADPAKTCLTCAKTGTYRARDLDGAVVEYQCDCAGQWKMHRWMLNAGIGLRYQRSSWTDLVDPHSDLVTQAFAYLNDAQSHMSTGTGLTLWSESSGTGKTLIATLVLKTLMLDGYDGYFTQFNDLLDASTSGWRDKDERAWFTMKVRNAGVLVIDDLGREYKGRAELVESLFDTVIRARVNACQPTIITTNYDPSQMKSGYGKNILSLFSEVNLDVHATGTDFRPLAKERLLKDRADGISTYPIVVG